MIFGQDNQTTAKAYDEKLAYQQQGAAIGGMGGTNIGLGQCVQDPKPGEVALFMTEQGNRIDSLESALRTLAQRLIPVMDAAAVKGDRPPSSVPEPQRPVRSTLAAEISNNNQRLAFLHGAVVEMLEYLCL